MSELTPLLKSKDLIDRQGIAVEKHIAETTVWDKLAKSDPTHAVISAGSEEMALEKSRAQIEELKSDLKDGVVLDLGCGYGRIAKYLLPQRTFAGYIGMDSAFNMLTLFKDRYAESEAEQQTPARFINADIHTIPLENDSVDNVIVAAVFLHNHKSVVEQSIEEIHRVLKPGGKIFVYGSFPNKYSLMGLQGSLYQMFLNLTGNPFKNGPVRYYGRKEVVELFEHFSEVDIRPAGFAILPKRLIFLPSFLDRLWRTLIANPINGLFNAILSRSFAQKFPMHHDVISVK